MQSDFIYWKGLGRGVVLECEQEPDGLMVKYIHSKLTSEPIWSDAIDNAIQTGNSRIYGDFELHRPATARSVKHLCLRMSLHGGLDLVTPKISVCNLSSADVKRLLLNPGYANTLIATKFTAYAVSQIEMGLHSLAMSGYYLEDVYCMGDMEIAKLLVTDGVEINVPRRIRHEHN